jgi:hypothetical protein
MIYTVYYQEDGALSVEQFTRLKDARIFCSTRLSLILRVSMNDTKFLSIHNNWNPCDFITETVESKVTDVTIEKYRLHLKRVNNNLSNTKFKWEKR